MPPRWARRLRLFAPPALNQRVVEDWMREQKLETALPNPPKITTGEVVVHKTSELVQA
jgi:hypothetical protein